MQGESPKLRLLAHDGDDVAVLSALLQDAIIPGSDMSFDRKLNEFVIIANRFCWELEPLFDVKSTDGKPIYDDKGKVMKGPNYFKPNLSKFVA